MSGTERPLIDAQKNRQKLLEILLQIHHIIEVARNFGSTLIRSLSADKPPEPLPARHVESFQVGDNSAFITLDTNRQTLAQFLEHTDTHVAEIIDTELSVKGSITLLVELIESALEETYPDIKKNLLNLTHFAEKQVHTSLQMNTEQIGGRDHFYAFIYPGLLRLKFSLAVSQNSTREDKLRVRLIINKGHFQRAYADELQRLQLNIPYETRELIEQYIQTKNLPLDQAQRLRSLAWEFANNPQINIVNTERKLWEGFQAFVRLLKEKSNTLNNS